MITDDTKLERLSWQQYDNNKSYRDKYKADTKALNIAIQKYNEILSYVFLNLDTTKFHVERNGIKINQWWVRERRIFRGINLNFYNYFEGRTCFRLIEFKGKAKDFKAKVLKKFEVLKSLRLESDNQTAIEGNRRIAEAIEIQELIKIAKRAFDKYKVDIEKNSCAEGYTLKLEIYFSDKRELLSFCDKEE